MKWTVAGLAAIGMSAASAAAQANDNVLFSVTDERGSVQTVVADRLLVSGLTGAMVRIGSPDGSVTLIEYLFDCDAGAYRYGAMRWGDAQMPAGEDVIAEMQAQTDLDMSSNLRAVELFPVENMGTPEIAAIGTYVCDEAEEVQ